MPDPPRDCTWDETGTGWERHRDTEDEGIHGVSMYDLVRGDGPASSMSQPYFSFQLRPRHTCEPGLYGPGWTVAGLLLQDGDAGTNSAGQPRVYCSQIRQDLNTLDEEPP